MPRLLLWGEKGPPASGAVAGRLLPVGQAGVGADAARLAGPLAERAGAAGAAVQLGRGGLCGLALEGLLQEFGAELAAEEGGQFFEGGEGGAPGRPLRAVEVVGQVFGRGGHDGA